MNKLLRAGFSRLGRSCVFWLLASFSAALAIFMCAVCFKNMNAYGDAVDAGQLMLNYSTLTGVVTAIFASIYIGVDYSDGAVRNKIASGHRRFDIYLSNLTVTTAAGLFSYVVFITVVAAVGIPLFGRIIMPLPRLFALLGCIFAAAAAYSAIFTFITMSASSRTVSAVLSLLCALALIMAALTCLGVLEQEKEILSGSVTDGESGEVEFVYSPNPRYPTESERKLYKTLLDINPAGQMLQLAGRAEPDFMLIPLCALSEFIAFTALGAFIFRRKDLR